MRRLFDRPDGEHLKKLSHYNRIIPFVMPKRVDSTAQFSQKLCIDEAEKVLREMNEEHGLNAGIMDLVMAAFVRTISQKPKVNRFVMGKKIFARTEISSSLALKKEMNENAETTEMKVIYSPEDTLLDVSKKIRVGIENNKGLNTENNQDAFTKILNLMPDFIISFIIGTVKLLDRLGLLPKSIRELSPFHASFFITNLGSLRINPVYHHLYQIGTVSMFLSIGKKYKENELQKDGTVKTKKYIDLKCVLDERIVDGFYAAQAIRLALRYINNPRLLLVPPNEVIVDNEI
ncbi:2-oxo acid dehydrogenase subunit E2 [Mycoplasmatota bacterium WC44]